MKTWSSLHESAGQAQQLAGLPMRTLLLLRHAKSSWQAPELPDLDRPLAPRGRQAAPPIARLIVKRGWPPHLVLCSPALRVQETWQLMAPVLGEGIVCKTLRTIYPGAPSRLMATLRHADDEAQRVMLIGHNPGLATFAASLCDPSSGGKSKKALEKMTAKFPTAGLAVIGFDVEHWRDVTTGAGRLEAFVRPKDLV